MPKTVKAVEIVPGVLLLPGVKFNKEAAERYFSPLVGKTIVSVQLQESEDSNDPEIILNFNDGSAAAILQDPEGNGPGFIEYLKP
jgi:hypothetical protein